MRSIFGFLIGMTGFIFAFGSVGLGVYLSLFAETDTTGAVEVLICSTFVGFVTLFVGYSILDSLAGERKAVCKYCREFIDGKKEDEDDPE